MSDLVNIQVDGVDMAVPKGLTVVDAAMRHGAKIPVFCHHPKLEPVGMCRMCLVRIGMPVRDRGTGELALEEDGSPKYNWGRGLQTGCTVRVADGMRVQSETEEVHAAREDILEFILSSHPLDCPICDKGGECPLQNLTMTHGEGKSRMYIGDKMKLDKHVPLGDLIWLDRERCIQCARCTRFQAEIADDPVIAFHNRGRSLEIVTLSDPGFDSIWSGNTTDICPVGALTTADFRFGARPWELVPVASLNPHGPVGENITMSTRREAKAGGKTVIKRIMPRQNEFVNETWIPDVARFNHHFAAASDRLTTPLVRKNGQLVEASWDEALTIVADNLQKHQETAAGLAGGRLSNEDLFLFQKLFRKILKNDNVDLADNKVAGGDVTAQVGIGSGTSLGELGKGDAILVVATDLHAAAPTWWLRVKQAAQRGATLVVANMRKTRLDRYAAHTIQLTPSDMLGFVAGLESSEDAAAQTLRDAENLVVFYGAEGLSYAESDAVAKTLGNMLINTNHFGREKNGLVAVWPDCNTQGAWDCGVTNGFSPGYREVRKPGLNAADVFAGKAAAVLIAGADPIGDGLLKSRDGISFMAVQELFMTETAQAADVVLPAQSWAERDGTYTNGERRVQRYYQAVMKMGDTRPDWQIIGGIINKINEDAVPFAASLIFAKEVAKGVRPYKAMTYQTLATYVEQFPKVGGDDLYYGGTSYENTAGVGEQWASLSEAKGKAKAFEVPEVEAAQTTGLKVINAPAPYTPGTLIKYSTVLEPRVAQPTVFVNEADAGKLGIATGDKVGVKVNGSSQPATAHVNGHAPAGVVLLQGFRYHADLESAEITRLA